MSADESSRWVEVAMRHPHPATLPAPALPDGIGVRWHRPGDEATWLDVQNATGLYRPLGPDLYRREFGDAPEHLAARQCFALGPDAEPLGTSTAWFGPDGVEDADGRLHWVAVVPAAWRGGLGRALTLVACRRALDLGHQGLYLTTGSANHPALRLYAGLGFEPWPRTPLESATWAGLARQGLLPDT